MKSPKVSGKKTPTSVPHKGFNFKKIEKIGKRRSAKEKFVSNIRKILVQQKFVLILRLHGLLSLIWIFIEPTIEFVKNLWERGDWLSKDD